VPGFTAEVLRERLVHVADEPPEHLLFFTRNGTPFTTNNIRRRLRAALEGTEITGVTPHSCRRTVATFVDRAGGSELAAELLGHTSSDLTKAHYIEPNEQVNPVTAEILEVLVPKKREG
jgi:integrase